MQKKLGILAHAIALALSIAAILLSLRANRSASTAVSIAETETPPLVLLSNLRPLGLMPYSSSRPGGDYIVCQYEFRLQNTTATPTSLIGFDLFAADGYGNGMHLSSEFGRAHAFATSRLLPHIGDFITYIFPGALDVSESTFGVTNELDLPAQLDPYSALDIQTAFRVFIESPLLEKLEDPSAGEDLLITLIYGFQFASGQTVSTPELYCWFHD